MANNWLQHLITIDTDPVVRVWTGQGTLTLDGADYAGGGKRWRSAEPRRGPAIPTSG